MNKLSIVTLIACAVSIPSAMAFGGGHPHGDPKGKVNFSGHVYSASCKIATGDQNKHVKLNPVLRNKVNEYRAEQLQTFTIQVKDCYTHEKLIPKLSWINNGQLTNQGFLKNMEANGAKNVALVLKDSNGKDIDLKDNSKRFEPEKYQVTGHKPTLTYKFSVGYIKPRESHLWDVVTAGPVSAQANYSITYL